MQVKVWNNNIHPYQEKFRDNLIRIEPNSFVEMDEDEADYFLQTFCPPKKDSQGRPDPLFFKKLKVEVPDEVLAARRARDPLVNHATGAKAANMAELAESLASFKHLLAAPDPDGEAEIAKKKVKELSKENKQLKTTLQLFEERLAKLEGTTSEKTDGQESL